MTAEDLLSLVELIENNGMGLWLDGGWGVDALLGEQTRPHRDVDIVIEHKDVDGLRYQLAASGFREVQRSDSSAWNFVLADDGGHEVDVRDSYDATRNGVYGPPELGLMYPASSLVGEGEVKGRIVSASQRSGRSSSTPIISTTTMTTTTWLRCAIASTSRYRTGTAGRPRR